MLDVVAPIAERLIEDPHRGMQEAVETILRGVGDVPPGTLRAVLDRHAPTMPRIALRHASEKLDRGERDRYLRAAG